MNNANNNTMRDFPLYTNKETGTEYDLYYSNSRKQEMELDILRQRTETKPRYFRTIARKSAEAMREFLTANNIDIKL